MATNALIYKNSTRGVTPDAPIVTVNALIISKPRLMCGAKCTNMSKPCHRCGDKCTNCGNFYGRCGGKCTNRKKAKIVRVAVNAPIRAKNASEVWR